MYISRLACLLLLPSTALLSSPAQAAFSGFVQEKGGGFAILSYSSFSSSELYRTNGERSSATGEFSQNNVNFYADIGVFDFLTVGAFGPVLRFNSFDTSEVGSGVGDLSLFAKVGSQLWGFHGAIMVAVELPTGQNELFVDTDFDGIRINLPTGDGETNVWTHLSVSRGFSVIPNLVHGFATLSGGINVRTQFAEQATLNADIGFNIAQWVDLIVGLESQFTLSDDLDPTGTFLFGDGTEFVAITAKTFITIPKTPLKGVLEYRNTFANLKNLYAGSAFGGGLAIQW